jgi:hypothetical protein
MVASTTLILLTIIFTTVFYIAVLPVSLNVLLYLLLLIYFSTLAFIVITKFKR